MTGDLADWEAAGPIVLLASLPASDTPQLDSAIGP